MPMDSMTHTVTSSESDKPIVVPNCSQPAKETIAKLVEIVGSANCLFDSNSVATYSDCTLPTGTTPHAIVMPGSRREVQRVMSVIAEHSLHWHAISRGKNWGYGDSCAKHDGGIIVDLKRMNQIIEVNEALGYAVIEPGVTQGQLVDYLVDTNSRLMLDVTGAGRDASVLGNTLQRGFGHTPYGDHFANSCNYEVVLPGGKVEYTGGGAKTESVAANVYPYGLGAYTQGLYSQSNAGVVTRMTIWLMPRPKRIHAFALKVPGENQLASIVDAIRELHQAGTIRGLVHIPNDLRVISARRRYPWDLTGGNVPLSSNIQEALRRDCGVGAWNVIGGLYGSKREVVAAQKEIRSRFKGIAYTHFITPSKVRLATRVGNQLERLSIAPGFAGTIRSVQATYGVLCGVPTYEHLASAYWRVKDLEMSDATITDIDRSRCGLIWIAPVLPLLGSACAEFINEVNPLFRKFTFEPLITVAQVSSRAACCVMNIAFDKQDKKETELAAQCHTEIKELIKARGYFPYRTASVASYQES